MSFSKYACSLGVASRSSSLRGASSASLPADTSAARDNVEGAPTTGEAPDEATVCGLRAPVPDWPKRTWLERFCSALATMVRLRRMRFEGGLLLRPIDSGATTRGLM